MRFLEFMPEAQPVKPITYKTGNLTLNRNAQGGVGATANIGKNLKVGQTFNKDGSENTTSANYKSGNLELDYKNFAGGGQTISAKADTGASAGVDRKQVYRKQSTGPDGSTEELGMKFGGFNKQGQKTGLPQSSYHSRTNTAGQTTKRYSL